MTKEALKLALEALETLMIERGSIYEQAITAIKEALANEALEKMAENARELGLDYELAQPEQHQDWCASLTQMLMSMPPKPAPCNCKPKPEPMAWIDKMVIDVPNKVFYTAPRTWVGLTEEEMQSIAFESADALSAVFVAEAKLRSKNESKN